MTLKVIGTGFGRTGTDSMREALNILGFGPCHHMFEVINNEDQKQVWRALGAGGPADWDTLLAGYQSCVDWPTVTYWPQLIAKYPDAKIILTWRTPESWWESFERTILPSIEDPDDKETIGYTIVRNISFSGKPITREHAIAKYEANVAAVKAAVPADRLLIYKLGDGWEPLCAHLNVAVPDVPFPRRNNTEEFHAALGDDQTK